MNISENIKFFETNNRNNSPLISVIVPIFNVELYLKRCVDSIINQTYTNLEILLIDDGSTDESPCICDQYASEDYRIKVVHKANGGLSDARNAGLDIMKGEYVTCIDSDDFVSPYYVENLYDALITTNCDMACSWFVDYYEGDIEPLYRKLDIKEVVKLNRVESYRKMLYQDGIEVSACSKLYKSKSFENIRFPKGKLYEDVATTYKLIERAESVAVIPNVDYCYFQRIGSIAKAKFNMRKLDAIVHMGELKDFIIENYPELNKAACCRYFSTVCNIFFLILDNEYSKEQEQLWHEIKKYRGKVLLDKNGRKKARIAALLSYFGVNVMRFIYQKIKR